MSISLEIVFNLKKLDKIKLWMTISSYCIEKLQNYDFFLLNGTKVDSDRILYFLEIDKKSYFILENKKFKIIYVHIANNNLSFLSLENCFFNYSDIFDLVTSIINIGFFIQARIFDQEYEYWQNANDILQYEAVNKQYNHLPMISNGLPYPLEQKIIDTSSNPGRRILRNKYIEAVGSIMWFGEQFWSIINIKKEEILKCRDFKTDIFNNILVIKSAEKPFSSDIGEERKVQERLRKLLFPHV
jgi:hypothetical protein